MFDICLHCGSISLISPCLAWCLWIARYSGSSPQNLGLSENRLPQNPIVCHHFPKLAAMYPFSVKLML